MGVICEYIQERDFISNKKKDNKMRTRTTGIKGMVDRAKKQKGLIKFTFVYLILAFVLFSFLFGIMNPPYRNLNTLSLIDQSDYNQLVKKYRNNQDKIYQLQRLDHISGYKDKKTPIIIKKIKKENEVINKKRMNIFSQADYTAWQYRLSAFIGWDYPFKLHRR